ncbi:gluconate 2-dehydrogenase subunit 3 family protein [Neolewinella aurantiaca]|uniref:Gluconate 2-dehydrogenase subunit 3 family protein n=1 Tax=Neolewinella aurantiaca TaxID=2602767 RepID=A0A5C7FKZ8_9BACT|nr:gluconate 2-dehydrogenase subunit 3 family protein [Neolewinella aurantiaca]TXF90633.1 gluconate 2-dehydrogenase subunit 3 family protein [Neolewinella aurantiaca]
MNRREILRYTAYATGFAISAPLASVLLTGCKPDAEMMAPDYKPGFFSEAEYEYITKFADTMLPKTDTPGAVEVGVPQMIDKVVGEVYSKEDAEKNRKGLQALMSKMDADNPGGFGKLDADKALIYLQDQDLHYKTGKVKTTMSGEDVPQEKMVEEAEATAKSAYFNLKSAIIGMYFQTEEVATTMLAYDPVPGEYIACGNLQELTGGKAWAL